MKRRTVPLYPSCCVNTKGEKIQKVKRIEHNLGFVEGTSVFDQVSDWGGVRRNKDTKALLFYHGTGSSMRVECRCATKDGGDKNNICSVSGMSIYLVYALRIMQRACWRH